VVAVVAVVAVVGVVVMAEADGVGVMTEDEVDEDKDCPHPTVPIVAVSNSPNTKNARSPANSRLIDAPSVLAPAGYAI
jgi:hypothetical protein